MRRFVLNAGTLIIHPRPSEGAEIAGAATVLVEHPGGEGQVTTYGDTKVVLPAGEQKVTVKIGQGEISETIQLAAGQTVEKDIIVGVGRVVANAYYVAGGDKVDAGGLIFQVVKAQKKIDGSREELGTEYGPDSKYDLPPGDYMLIARMDEAVAEAPFSLAAGEAKSIDVNLDAGVLAVTAPGAYEIDIFAAKKDIDGNRKPFGSAFADAFQTTLPPGDYAILVTLPNNGGTREGTATVKAGERAEVKIQ